MEDNLSKGKCFGQILAICALGVIMLLFKLVQPLSSIIQTLPSVWNEFATLMIYAFIEFVLIILICCHFIFGKSFKSLGIKNIKNNIGVFVINALYLGGCVGITYFIAQMSKAIDFDGLKIGLTIVSNLLVVAFIKEVIFRGFLLRGFDKLFGNKGFGTGVLASAVVAILFACTFVPDTIMNLSNVSKNALLQAMIWPIALSFYLGMILYLTDNLVVCVNIHWVCMSLAGLSADFFSSVFYGIYVVVMAIYLIYSLMKYIRAEENIEEESEEDYKPIEQADTALKSNEDAMVVNDTVQESINEIQPVLKDEVIVKQSEEPVEIPYFKEMMAQEAEDETALSQMDQRDQHLQETMMMPAVEETDTEKTIVMPAVEETDMEKTTVMPAVEETDMEKTTVMPAVEEADMEKTTMMPVATDGEGGTDGGSIRTTEFEETVVIPAICEEEEIVRSSGAIKVDFEKTMIMPAITEEEEDLSHTAIMTNVEETVSDSKVIPFQMKSGVKEDVATPNEAKNETETTKMKVKAEPNYIAHLEKYLGEFEGIFKQMTPTDPPIDIMFFKGERYNALVTNGMRSMPMALPPELGTYQQLELMMFLDKSIEINDSNIENEENAWLIKLLIDLALFPKATGSYMGVGHIVGNGEELEPYCSSSDYCGALIFPPMEQENVKFYRYVEKGNTIYIHNVMPLFREELRFIQEHSADQFINLMSEVGVRQIVKRQRVNVIKAFNDEK